MIATDFDAICELVYKGGVVHSWPLGPGVPGYTPLEELPASARELYTYDVAKAKQMLADEGYPDGFKIEIEFGPHVPEALDIVAMLTAMWEKVGVEVSLKAMEPAALSASGTNRAYKDLQGVHIYTVVSPFTVLGRWRSDTVNSRFSEGEPFDAMYWQASGTVDADERKALIEEMAIVCLEDAADIPFANPYNLTCYWPWVKNYYGEIDCGYYKATPMIKRLWIDQDLKKEMGY